MNFYSDRILNDMMDKDPIHELVDSIDTFKLQCKYVLTKHSARIIGHKYIDWLLNDPNAIVAFYCFDQEFCVYNCPSILVYRRFKYNPENLAIVDAKPWPDEIRYYVLLTCTKRNMRGQGYGSKLLDQFQQRIRDENRKNDKKLKIILSSVEDAVLFYEAYGFRWTRESIIDHPVLLNYEHYESGKHYFILELIVDRDQS